VVAPPAFAEFDDNGRSSHLGYFFTSVRKKIHTNREGAREEVRDPIAHGLVGMPQEDEHIDVAAWSIISIGERSKDGDLFDLEVR
jgi:hypothetical protein